MTDNNETLDMLDETLDDLSDLPKVTPFPAGAHLVSIVVKRNEKKRSTFIVELTHKETIELTSPTENEEDNPNPGDKSTVFIHTKSKDGKVNEFGQGQIKEILKPLAVLANSKVIDEILSATAQGVDVVAVLGVRKAKDENYQDQQDIKSITVV